ncbi:MAG TPA: hypothetical protein VE631_02015, partial [Alphaproteobacteria bacterium]|nr:hypothetical protein [Alphaproteobacteria bacterium]
MNVIARIEFAPFLPWPVLAALALIAAGWHRDARREPSTSVAVLPFAEYSPDEQDRLLAERLTDGVTREL